MTDTAYDSAGNVARTNNAYWTTSVSPSAVLFVPSSETAIPSEVLNQYDGAGRPTTSTLYSYGVVQTTTTAYEAADETDVTPPSGGTPESTFVNSLGEKTKLVQYLASTPDPAATTEATTYGYDPQGSMTSMTDPAGNQWTWGFNVLGQQTSASDPDTGTTTSTYDLAGDVLTSTDARGVTLAYTYDNQQRKTAEYKRTSGQPDTELASWAYDPAGDLGQAASSTSYVGSTPGTPGLAYTDTVTGYDAGYRPTGEQVGIPLGAPAFGPTSPTAYAYYPVTYTYNVAGLLNSTVYPAEGGLPAETVKTSYDGFGNATALGTATTTYALTMYNPIGGILEQNRVGSTGLTSVATGYAYDAGTNDVDEMQSLATTGTTATVAEDNQYRYDPDGNITSIAMTSDTLASDTQCFSYDHLQDLTEAWTPASNDCSDAPSVAGLGGAAPYWDSYVTDPQTGNRTSSTQHGAGTGGSDVLDSYFYPAATTDHPHALQSMQQTVGADASVSDYDYDAAGDTTTRPGQTVTYDAEGKVSTISDRTDTESDIYTADGSLLLQTDSADGATLFDGDTEFHVASGSTAITATRIYSANGNPVAERSTTSGSSVLTWLIADDQGTVNLEIDPTTGALTYRAQDPFGNPRGTSPGWSDDRGFLDAPLSAFSDLTQLGARLYDATIGKFLSVDPVLDPGDPQQNNGYDYAHNNPVSQSDPSGLLSGESPGCAIMVSQCQGVPYKSGGSSGSKSGGSGGKAPPAAGDSDPDGDDQQGYGGYYVRAYSYTIGSESYYNYSPVSVLENLAFKKRLKTFSDEANSWALQFVVGQEAFGMQLGMVEGGEVGVSDTANEWGRFDGRTDKGQWAPGSGILHGAAAEATGIEAYVKLTKATVSTTKVRASFAGVGKSGGRFYDGLALKSDGTYEGIEVKSGTAARTASQKLFDSAVNGGMVARAKLNGKFIDITSVELVRVR